MILIIGVRFRKSGKIYYFDPIGLPIEKGNHVIVETARGVEYGTVVLGPKQVTDDKIVSPLKPVMRIATEKDDAINEENEAKEKDAFKICLEKIRKHGLQMKLIDSEYTFDRNKLLFYFTADGRIDFRELVKDLASVFRTRIELRQIGVRDETKMIGGIAICGRPLCCHSYLSDFIPVSIKMAKEQNLSLNPAKISGVCGRLMCCLKNEQEAYEYLNSTLPNIDTQVQTCDGYTGTVQSVSVLKQRVKVLLTKENDEKEVREYSVDELTFDKRGRSKGAPIAQPLPDEDIDESELKQLEIMEQEDLDDLTEENEKPAAKPTRKNRGGRREYRNDNNRNRRSDNEGGSYNENNGRRRNNENGSYNEHGNRRKDEETASYNGGNRHYNRSNRKPKEYNRKDGGRKSNAPKNDAGRPQNPNRRSRRRELDNHEHHEAPKEK